MIRYMELKNEMLFCIEITYIFLYIEKFLIESNANFMNIGQNNKSFAYHH